MLTEYIHIETADPESRSCFDGRPTSWSDHFAINTTIPMKKWFEDYLELVPGVVAAIYDSRYRMRILTAHMFDADQVAVLVRRAIEVLYKKRNIYATEGENDE